MTLMVPILLSLDVPLPVLMTLMLGERPLVLSWLIILDQYPLLLVIEHDF